MFYKYILEYSVKNRIHPVTFLSLQNVFSDRGRIRI